MQEHHYKAQLKRRRGRWIAYVPELPGDSPRVELDRLDNVEIEVIVQVAGYLGVNPSLVGVRVDHPVRAPRKPWRERLSMGAVQLGGAVGALGGLYLAAGAAATLIAAGVATVAAATGKEAGWI